VKVDISDNKIVVDDVEWARMHTDGLVITAGKLRLVKKVTVPDVPGEIELQLADKSGNELWLHRWRVIAGAGPDYWSGSVEVRLASKPRDIRSVELAGAKRASALR
jgi:hypothetical protein